LLKYPLAILSSAIALTSTTCPGVKSTPAAFKVSKPMIPPTPWRMTFYEFTEPEGLFLQTPRIGCSAVLPLAEDDTSGL